MSPYKIPCGAILGHFLRQNTLYESAVNGHLYFFFPPPFFHAFFHRGRSKISPGESGLPSRIRPDLRKFGKPTAFTLRLLWNARTLEVNSGENLPFSFCFFTIREYRRWQASAGLRSEVSVD